ncbi:serine protease [Tropicimonas sp. IMCC6043]|uniref:trypsin-like serine peptidase n=1 Tax=Tropicimonas sp. IMCC6043 TaxID=2510645 RepID=UPI0013EA0949|nr:trypsin-like peptidase domain-containing protein [Tropicimonas sp. IMCC6043]
MPTLLPEAEQATWNAVGRVNIAGLKRRSMCSGTLVAPDLVLTAAHCLFRPDGHAARPVDVHFVAGWRGGAFAAHRQAAEIIFHPDYAPSLPPLAERVVYDVAFLRLDTPIVAAEATPVPLADLPADPGPLTIIGYRRDRPHALSRQQGCAIRWRDAGVLGLDCPVMEGSSGAPVLAAGPDGWRVVALVAARASRGGRIASLAALVAPGPIPAKPAY